MAHIYLPEVGSVGWAHTDYETNLSSQTNLHSTGWVEKFSFFGILGKSFLNLTNVLNHFVNYMVHVSLWGRVCVHPLEKVFLSFFRKIFSPESSISPLAARLGFAKPIAHYGTFPRICIGICIKVHTSISNSISIPLHHGISINISICVSAEHCWSHTVLSQ